MNSSVPTLPNDPWASDEEPVSEEPWEAQAFALVLSLSEQGLFQWSEWSAALATEIGHAGDTGDQDLGDTYYHYWLVALEKLLLEKSVLDSETVESRVEEWRRAYLHTPHGQPIELSAGQEPANT